MLKELHFSIDKKTLLFIIIISLIIFLFSSVSLHAVDHKWHADATRIAMKEHGFSDDARLLVQFTNFLVDFFAVINEYAPLIEEKSRILLLGMISDSQSGSQLRTNSENIARLHFDNLTSTQQFEYQWKKLEENTMSALKRYSSSSVVKSGFRTITLFTIIGASLHALQDFYTHSNWVEECLKHAENGTETIPTWFEVSPEKRKQFQLVSGVYPEGDTPGILYHKELHKDNSQRQYHAEAAEVMNRASIEWIAQLLTCTEVPWDALRTYTVKTIPTQNWLRKTDASLITSIATIAGHWDGPEPVSRVFNSDPVKDRVQAVELLILLIGDYSLSFTRPLVDSNPYKLPTPNWAGFFVYHIEGDLGDGLLPLRDVNSNEELQPFEE